MLHIIFTIRNINDTHSGNFVYWCATFYNFGRVYIYIYLKHPYKSTYLSTNARNNKFYFLNISDYVVISLHNHVTISGKGAGW